jgi:hypothetical protein
MIYPANMAPKYLVLMTPGLQSLVRALPGVSQGRCILTERSHLRKQPSCTKTSS